MNATPGNPAWEAGLREGDVIVQLGEVPIANTGDLSKFLIANLPGDEVALLYYRSRDKDQHNRNPGRASVRLAMGQPVETRLSAGDRRRRSIRLKAYDYTRSGAYFVTLCAYQRRCIFGRAASEEIHLSKLGQVVLDCWKAVPEHSPGLSLDHFVVMPNHLHAILIIDDSCRGTACRAPTKAEQFGGPVRGSLPTIIRSFKAAVTKRVNAGSGTLPFRVWQRNYYEHIVRSEEELSSIREYTADNPRRWAEDEYNPDRALG